MASFLSPVPVLAAGGIADINPGLTLWTAITFLVMLVVLGKFAWGPIVKMLAERERSIREAIDSAKKERAEAERLLAAQKESLAKAQREAAELARRNQQEVEALRQELTAKARKEADELVAEARRQIAEELGKAKTELKAQVVDLAIDAASRLVKANLDEKAQRALVEEYIAQLPANRAA
ncbi:ATP synthase F0, B subunit [Anaeromyxobacter sp. K]|uniref:ATP synthase subunit b n=1 Tax=Anaeromyxobacter sp. (strain K) TaxID=447217 RepID=ATPF_ANASK|nr:F0F1 ATP synthase subunit B [Anaeromyxobacter sp. K]B4UJU5.1 RecName: Full=ATP synthase subunit b; AltName: Full=ATP synthase F(0) sector subunit b; AltName: Full=ATPase subunit I; AltName: Full=F-type ATPase subunit b; Short=F-ATPase subunit b [Anaeromyxobacter sp. K]ACG75676.1 ATP synthase F0, B subunit [Anaeromyxobacter sp. K]